MRLKIWGRGYESHPGHMFEKYCTRSLGKHCFRTISKSVSIAELQNLSKDH